MSEKKHEHHHHFPHHKEEKNQNATPYEKAIKEEKHHKRMGHLGELGAVAAGTFALVLYIYLIFVVTRRIVLIHDIKLWIPSIFGESIN